jgi:hypothetical protein
MLSRLIRFTGVKNKVFEGNNQEINARTKIVKIRF